MSTISNGVDAQRKNKHLGKLGTQTDIVIFNVNIMFYAVASSPLSTIKAPPSK